MLRLKHGILWLLLLMAVGAQGQNLVYLLHSNTLSFDEKRLPDAQILRGDVIFRHDSALMYCDSAYFFDKQNSLYAFSHVRYVQGDTLFGYGDAMYYDGNTKIARIRKHVKLVHYQTILTTDSLNYDRRNELAYYFSGGKIVDSLNTLTSVWGQYNPPTSQAVFKTDVHLVNPNFILTSDTLWYNTEAHIADIVSPTTIVYEKETTILSDSGQYNTENEQSKLYNRSRVIHQEGKDMTGDTIYYDKANGYGRILGAMEMRDTVQQATLYGNYGEYYEDGNRGMATDSALMVDWSSEDYSYIHADTLFTEDMVDSVQQDSTFTRIRAHHKVRIYRIDLQAVCDSLVYNGKDSIMTLYTEPICWNENNQLSADTIHLYIKNGAIDHVHGIGTAFAVKQETATYFDQMSGKEMKGFVREDELKQVEVSGNAETIFYPEDNHEFIGMNRTQSSFVNVFIEDEKIHHVLFTASSSGTLYPLDQVPVGQDRLSGFFWAETERPRYPGDVFNHPERTPRPKGAPISASANEDEENKTKGNTTRNKKNRKE